jgi:hypothetical protein
MIGAIMIETIMSFVRDSKLDASNTFPAFVSQAKIGNIALIISFIISKYTTVLMKFKPINHLEYL